MIVVGVVPRTCYGGVSCGIGVGCCVVANVVIADVNGVGMLVGFVLV